MTDPFSCDLVPLALEHKRFLRTIDSLGEVLKNPSESIRRYRDLWLPLVSSSKERHLIPPADVAWLWHCHRLAPRHYNNYVEERYGKILEADPPFSLQTSDSKVETGYATSLCDSFVSRWRWEEMYPDEPFFVEDRSTSSNTKEEKKPTVKKVGEFDLFGSAKKQASSLSLFSSNEFEDEGFLRKAVDRYHKFLILRSKFKEKLLVPTTDMDLMWHTHILSRMENYNKDCTAIIGETLHHNDPMADEMLTVLQDDTKRLWEETFGEPYSLPRKSAKRLGGIPKWADVDGITSNGSRAFMPYKDESILRREKYVYGQTSHGRGFYHVETREAHEIMRKRITDRLERGVCLKWGVSKENPFCTNVYKGISYILSMCFLWTLCFLGALRFTIHVHQHLKHFPEYLEVIEDRLRASRPSGERFGGTDYYSSTGKWLYPEVMWRVGGGITIVVEPAPPSP